MLNAKSSDLDMLMTCRTIAENFSRNIKDLKKANRSWNEEYAAMLSNEIDSALSYFLGLEANKNLENSRNKFNQIQAQALRAISFLKTRIDIMYVLNKKKKNKVLDQLGFKKYLQAVQNKDTNALLELLVKIEKNMKEPLKKELIKNPGDQAFIDRIIQFASKIQKVNESQRSLMATKKAIEEDAKEVFNNLLLKILELSQMVTYVYKDDPDKAKLFDYTSVLSTHFPDAIRSN